MVADAARQTREATHRLFDGRTLPISVERPNSSMRAGA